MRWFVLLFVACGPVVSEQQRPPPPPTRSPPADAITPTPPVGGGEKLSGTITQIDFGCARDASCDLTLDARTIVHFGHDTRGENPRRDWGKVDDALWAAWHDDPKHGVGKRVEVFAAKDQPDHYTIQGSTTYYIKLVP